MTLTEFLLARIAEDESGDDAQLVGSTRKDWSVRWKAECEVKRRIVDLHSGGHECPGVGRMFWDDDADWTEACPTLRFAALPYAEHPDCDEAWRL